MTALWAPKYVAYKDGLDALSAMTEDELRAAVDQLPPEIRARLAEGPRPYRWDCGVCEAFGKAWYMDVVPDVDDPRWVVFGYHDAPKARMVRADQMHYGPLANECYVRTLAVYRAAGWNGESPAANA